MVNKTFPLSSAWTGGTKAQVSVDISAGTSCVAWRALGVHTALNTPALGEAEPFPGKVQRITLSQQPLSLNS